MATQFTPSDKQDLFFELVDEAGLYDLAGEMLADLAAYADAWDADADAQRVEVEAWDDLAARADAGQLSAAPTVDGDDHPEPTPPATPTRASRTAFERARDKAAYHLACGIRIVREGSTALVPSGTRGGVVYRVADGRCTCEAGAHGRTCWHAAAAELAA